METYKNFRSGEQKRQTMFHPSGKLLAIMSLSLLLIIIGYHPLTAQSSKPEKKWHFLTDVYLMFPYMDGETGIGESLILPVDVSGLQDFIN